ncbi:MAG: hypothetical protein DWQ01_06235 [Planctomycetota bacterium]|nr:MAG: hypothetical protein DWQ01_06235 [Planctomycetota bacterium]
MTKKHPTRAMSDTEPRIQVDPRSVECGFIMFPLSLYKGIDESVTLQALNSNMPQFWPSVLEANSSTEIYRLGAGTVDPDDLFQALHMKDRYVGHSIVIGIMRIFGEGVGSDGAEAFVGFCWRDSSPTVIFTRPDGVEATFTPTPEPSLPQQTMVQTKRKRQVVGTCSECGRDIRSRGSVENRQLKMTCKCGAVNVVGTAKVKTNPEPPVKSKAWWQFWK